VHDFLKFLEVVGLIIGCAGVFGFLGFLFITVFG